MTLLTIADLQTVGGSKAQYIEHAKQLSRLWEQWKAQQSGSYKLKVDFFGEGGRSTGIHASESSGCLRKLVYGILGTERIVLPDQKDVNMQRRFDVGTLQHALIQYELEEMCKWLRSGGVEIYFSPEAKVSPKLGGVAAQWNVHSHCDGIFEFCSQGQPYLRVGLEIKTMSAPEFEKLKEPKDYHQDQMCIYMVTLDLPLMWYLAYNKSNSLFTHTEAPWLFQFNQRLWETKLQPRFQTATQMASAGQLPAREEGKPCSWCAFAHTCQPNYLRTSGRVQAAPSAREL